MKFGKFLEREAYPICESEEIKEAMMMYKILKKYINVLKVDGAQRCTSLETQAGDQCDICMQPWTLGPGIITSKCNHSFHPACIWKCFDSEQSACQCPVCGCTKDRFMPVGFDGEVLQFLAMIRMNVNSVESNHAVHMNELLQRNLWIQQLVVDSNVPDQGAVRELLMNEVKNLCTILLNQVKAAQFYGWVCYEGIRKIIKKFDKQTMLQTSPAFLESMQAHAFFRDCCCSDSGPLAAMRRELLQRIADAEDCVSRREAAGMSDSERASVGQSPAQTPASASGGDTDAGALAGSSAGVGSRDDTEQSLLWREDGWAAGGEAPLAYGL